MTRSKCPNRAMDQKSGIRGIATEPTPKRPRR